MTWVHAATGGKAERQRAREREREREMRVQQKTAETKSTPRVALNFFLSFQTSVQYKPVNHGVLSVAWYSSMDQHLGAC